MLATHGLQDENVRPDHFSKWWYALSEDGVPRHARLMQVGHVDPFDVDRADGWTSCTAGSTTGSGRCPTT